MVPQDWGKMELVPSDTGITLNGTEGQSTAIGNYKLTSGKWYYEVEYIDAPYSYLGWARHDRESSTQPTGADNKGLSLWTTNECYTLKQLPFRVCIFQNFQMNKCCLTYWCPNNTCSEKCVYPCSLVSYPAPSKMAYDQLVQIILNFEFQSLWLSL